MRTLKALVTGVALAILLGCATTPSERASHVQIISPEDAKQYDFVARVQASSSLTGVSRDIGYQNALNAVLDQAAAKGASFIVLDENSKAKYWTSKEIVSASAYKRKQ